MADRLTQLQDALDQLLTQMFASITYIDTRHPPVMIPGQVDQHQPASQLHHAASNNANTAAATEQAAPPPQDDSRHQPEESVKFRETMRELAQDLVLKHAQIEALVDGLPGLGNSRIDQEKRIEELNAELQQVEKEREEARVVREQLLKQVEGRIVAARRF